MTIHKLKKESSKLGELLKVLYKFGIGRCW